MAKIVTKEEFKIIKSNLKDKKIGLCHGVYDLVHPGHIIHFNEAKSICDILVVSVTAAKYVRKGPGRPYFGDDLRLMFLANLACVDYVMLSEGYTVDDIVECVKPDYYIKGQEYAKSEDDVTGNIDKEVNLVRMYGGDVYYTNGQVFSSTKLLNRGFSALSSDVVDFATELLKKYSMEDIVNCSTTLENKKILVIGDVIIDKYVYCSVQGLMSKDTAYSARLFDSEEQLGGSVAIARHIAQFCKNTTLCSVIGNEEKYRKLMETELNSVLKLELIQSPSFPTIVKERYVQKHGKRSEYDKLFVVNNIPNPVELDSDTNQKLYELIKTIIKEYDAVVVCDFGHGLIDSSLIELIQSEAKFLAVNCQTNSTNRGMNIITKYTKANVFSLDQAELKLAYPLYGVSEHEALRMLARHMKGNGWLTRGSNGAYSIDHETEIITECPVFTLSIVDTIGAGDAFFSVASAYSVAGAPVELALFMGNVAGALATNIVGNQKPVDKPSVLKYCSTILNI